MSERRFTGTRRRALAVVAGFGLVASALPVASSVAVEATSTGSTTTGSAITASQFQDGNYIVVLQDAPLATHPSTTPAQGDKLDVDSNAAQAYTDRLLAQQDQVLAQVEAEASYRYTTTLNGFAVQLTAQEAAALAQRADVASVTPDGVRQLTDTDQDFTLYEGDSPARPDTEVSLDLLGLRGEGGVWEQLGGADQAGAGTVVGVIDSGTAWDNPSFSAEAIPAPPTSFSGECETGPRWPDAACNNKSVSGEFFIEGFQEAGAAPSADEVVSPYNTDTHGSHVASTAAGRQVTLETGGGDVLDIGGMAPAAHVATYKVCWLAENPAQTGCYSSDSIAAIDAAVGDGVDVLNFSVSGDPATYADPVDLAFKNAAAAGVFVAASAGNGNEDNIPVAHIGPWMTTVGAAHHRTAEQIPPGAPPAVEPIPSIASFSGRGPVAVPEPQQTILKPDIGAPGVLVLAAASPAEDGTPQWGYLTGTSMSSPHIAGLGLLQVQANPDFSPMAVKSSLMTSAIDYAIAESNDPFVGGAGFVEPPSMLTPGLVFESTEAEWDAFLADPTTGTALNQASVQIPALTADTATTVTRTVTNVSDEALTYTASTEGPATMSVVVTPATATIPAGASAEVTIAVANTGAPATEWQKTWLTWSTDGAASDVRIPVIARGEVTDEEPAPMVDRVKGLEPDADRYGTAAEIARLYPEGVETVYVTTGESYYDSLAGAPSAARGMVPGTQTTPDGDPAPVVLVEQDSIPDITSTVLGEIDPANVVILGGTVAVSEGVQAELEAEYGEEAVERIGGPTRYDTAALLAQEYGTADTVYVATGETAGFGDALSGSALAGSEGVPMLLTKKGEVPQVVTDTIDTLGATEIVVLGGSEAITDETFAELGGTSRLSGPTRYETSAAITAEFGYGDGQDAPVAHVASGRNFPDALAGAALAGSQDAPVLLTEPGMVPDSVLAQLDEISPDQLFILGGTVAVSQAVEDRLNEEYPRWAE